MNRLTPIAATSIKQRAYAKDEQIVSAGPKSGENYTSESR